MRFRSLLLFCSVCYNIFCFLDRCFEVFHGIACVIAVQKFLCGFNQINQRFHICFVCYFVQFCKDCFCCCIYCCLICIFIFQNCFPLSVLLSELQCLHNFPDVPGSFLLLLLQLPDEVSVRHTLIWSMLLPALPLLR